MKRLLSYSLVVLLGLAFVFPTTPSWSAGTLKVITPNGGQKWKTGKKYTIKWVKGNAGRTVKIQLLKSNEHYKWVSKKTKNDGKHPWRVPASVATGSAYKIIIVSTKNKKVFDKSNKNFSITKVGGDTGGDTDSLEVSTPDAGESWTTGKKYVIKWVKGNGGAFVKIQLLKSGKHHKWISKKTKNDGKHPWKIPASVTTGSAYKVKIVSTKNRKVFDKSNKNFTIIKSGGSGGDDSLEVISPNGGESWKKGDVVSIEWEKGTVSSNVRLFLYRSGKRYKTITPSTTNDGLRRWSIPKTIATSSAYKIRVQSKTKARQYDDSDSNFTITGGTTTGSKVSLSCNSSSASEGGGKITCTLSLSASTTKAVTVKVSYAGTATAGTDYSGKKTTHTIAAGKTSTSWKLTGKSDSKTEGSETIVINVTSVTNATESGTQRKTLTLTEGKSSLPKVTLSCTPSSLDRNGPKGSKGKGPEFTCTLNLSKPAYDTVKVGLIFSGSAKCGSDILSGCASPARFYIVQIVGSKFPGGGKTSKSWVLATSPSKAPTGDKTLVIHIQKVEYGNSREDGMSNGTQQLTLTIKGIPKPSGDYQYLYDNNAYNYGGRTARWGHAGPHVYGVPAGPWRDAVDRWSRMSFGYKEWDPSRWGTGGIKVIGFVNGLGNSCARANWTENENYWLQTCEIRLNAQLPESACGTWFDTLTHEIGHCIGFFNHTSDGGVMDRTGGHTITAPVKDMVRLLYSINPGTNVLPYLSSSQSSTYSMSSRVRRGRISCPSNLSFRRDMHTNNDKLRGQLGIRP